MIGAIIGDVTGSVYEFNNIKTKDFELFNEESSYTDDTLMTIAVAMAAYDCRDDFSDFSASVVRRMREIGRRYPCPMGGYGGGFRRWLMSAEPKPYGSYGNGSAMRASACGEIAETLEQALDLAKTSAEVTHNHPDGIRGAQTVAAAVFMAAHGSDKDEIRRYVEENFYELRGTADEIRRTYSFDPGCRGTVPQALIAFLESSSFEDALRTAVSLGGDSDTLADITCAVAWPYYARRGADESMLRLRRHALGLLPDNLREFTEKWENEFCGGKELTEAEENLTEIVFILDRSGSMSGLEADTVGGFNSLIEKQKAEKGRALVSVVLFNHDSSVLYDRVDIGRIEPMSPGSYVPCGSTALLDALGGAIRHIGNIHKYARPEDVPQKTLFVITTDGMENASRRYTADEVRSMVRRQKSKYGWEFLFLGANIDAVQTAGNFGIEPDKAVEYTCDDVGTRLNFDVLGKAVRSLRTCGAVPNDWKKEIEADRKKRR